MTSDEVSLAFVICHLPIAPTLTPPSVRNTLRPMKAAARKPPRKVADKARPRMTRELAEARAVGSGKGKFDGVAFLRTLKK